MLKLSSILSFAMDEIVGRVKQFLTIIIVFAVGIILLGTAIYLYESTSFYSKISDESLSHGNKGTFCCAIQPLSNPFITDMNIVDKMRKVEGVESSGLFGISEIDVTLGKKLDTIENLQKGSPYKENDGVAQGINMGYGAVGLFNISLEDGYEFEKPDTEDVRYMYLGNKLSSIPIGTSFEQTTYYKPSEDAHVEEKTIKLIVKGYIREGSKIVNGDVVYRNKSIKDFYYDMDYLFLCVKNDDCIETDNIFLTYNVKDDYDVADVREKMNKIANAGGVPLVHSNYEEAFQSRESDNMRLYSYIIQIAVIILVTVIVLQICMQSMNIISNSGNYGIMYANGVSKKDLRGIIVTQSLIKYIFSLVLAFVILVVLYVLYGDVDNKFLLSEFIYCIKHFVLLKSLVISFVIMVVGTVVPILVIESMTPVQLIKSKQ